MKTKFTLILTFILCLILIATACTERQLLPTPEPVSDSQANAFKVTQTPDTTVEPTPTPEPTSEPTPKPTLEPFGAEIWAEIREQGFLEIDVDQINGLTSAFYAELSEGEISALLTEAGCTSASEYILRLFYAGWGELHPEPEPTKSIGEMSFYEQAYYYATPEQRERLENIRKLTGENGDYLRQIWMITGKLAEDTPRLTLEQAREICAEAGALNLSREDAILHIVNRFMEICGAPDHIDPMSESSSPGYAYLFYLDDDAAEYIFVRSGRCYVDYVYKAAGIKEHLMP